MTNKASERSPDKLLKGLSEPEALQLIPEAMARKYIAIPLAINYSGLQVAIADPEDIFALEALASQSQMRIDPEIASAEEIQEAIDFNYKAYGEIEKQISDITFPSDTVDGRITMDTGGDSPVARALALIIDDAVRSRASDIHLEPEEDKLRVRYRIDGTLHDALSMPLAATSLLVSRIKILADLNIADHHRPQDGQFSVKAKNRPIDIRIATAPTVRGEMASLRLLYKSRATLELSELGFLPESLAKYEDMLRVPYGMILVSGPTGAGKTTTLYASINQLDNIGQNIITIEDPVEYRFKNINQIQVNTRTALTFATGLRSIVRLDPDVILVGEIRDAETASIAVQAALTGHLVLSSIHANDAAGVLFRLIDLGIEPFIVSSALIGVVAQRMVRKTCHYCARPVNASTIETIAYNDETGEEQNEFYYGSGCKTCAHTGYLGRTGIFEILYMSDGIRTELLRGTTASQLRTQAIKEGLVPMMKDGMLKVKSSITTPSEVLRNTYSIG